MRICSFIIVLIYFMLGITNSSDAQNAGKKAIPQTAVTNNDDRFTDKFERRISQFPSFKRWSDRLNKKGTKVTWIVWSKPRPRAIYYVIQVGIDDSTRFRPIYTFHCYKNGRMLLLNTSANRLIPVVNDIPVNYHQ